MSLDTAAETTTLVYWPAHWRPEEARTVAAATFALLLNTRRWVHRRTELISFIDENSIRRRVSVDFTLPSLPGGMLDERAGRRVAYVPLTLLRKRVLRSFDLRDEDGRVLPLLTRAQNSAIAREMLLRCAQAVLGAGERLADDVAADLAAITSADDHAGARPALERLCRPADGCPSASQRRALMSEPRLRALTEDLVHSFLLLVPVAAQPGVRRILKFSYEEEPGPRLYGRRGRLSWLAQTFGWAPVPYLLPASSMGDSASYHAEVEVPEDLEVARTRTVDLKRGQLLADNIEPSGAQRVHIYSPGKPRTVWGLAEVSVLVSRSGLLMAMLFTSLLTAMMLTLGLARLEEVAQTTDATSALLLAIPAIFAGYLLRPEEHPLVTKLFAGLRCLVLLSGLCALLACGMLVAQVPGPALHLTWEWLVRFSWLLTAALAVAAFVPRRPKRRVRRRVDRGDGGSPQGLPPAGLDQAVCRSNLGLAGLPVESAEGWRSSFTGVDSDAGIRRTLTLALAMLNDTPGPAGR